MSVLAQDASAATRSVTVVPKRGVFATSRPTPVHGRVRGFAAGAKVSIIKLAGPGAGATGRVRTGGRFTVSVKSASRAGTTYYRAVVGTTKSARFSITTLAPAAVVVSKPAVLPTRVSSSVAVRTVVVPAGTAARLVRESDKAVVSRGVVRNGAVRLTFPASAATGDRAYRVVAGRATTRFRVTITKAVIGPGTGVTVLLKPTQLIGVPAPGTDGHVRLAPGTPAPRVGDTIAAGVGSTTPYGFLGRITAIQTVSGGLVARTVPARLDQVLPSGNVSTSIRIDTQSSTVLPATPGSSPQARAGNVSCGAGAAVTATATADVSATLEPVLEWGLLRPSKVGLVATASASASAKLTATGAASCSLEHITLMQRTLTPVTVMAGPIPVVLVPRVEAGLDGGANVTGATGATVSASLTARAGLIREDGRNDVIADLGKNFSHNVEAPSASGSAHAGVDLELEVLLYGAVGPEVGFETGLELGVDGTKTPWWWLDAPLRAHAEIDVPALDVSSPEIELYSGKVRLAESGQQEGVTGSPTTATTKLSYEVKVDSAFYGAVETGELSGPLSGSSTGHSNGKEWMFVVLGYQRVNSSGWQRTVRNCGGDTTNTFAATATNSPGAGHLALPIGMTFNRFGQPQLSVDFAGLDPYMRNYGHPEWWLLGTWTVPEPCEGEPGTFPQDMRAVVADHHNSGGPVTTWAVSRDDIASDACVQNALLEWECTFAQNVSRTHTVPASETVAADVTFSANLATEFMVTYPPGPKPSAP